MTRPTCWQTINSAPGTADNSGSAVLNPGAAARAAISPMVVAGAGTGVLLRYRYPSASVPTTSPVIQLFGRDAAGRYQELKDEDGNTSVTLTITSTTDVKETMSAVDYQSTPTKKFDALNCVDVVCMIKTAAAGGGYLTSLIEARPY